MWMLLLYVDWMFSVGTEMKDPAIKVESWFDWYSNLLLCNLATLSNHCGTYV